MRGFLAVFEREIAEHRLLFLIGLAGFVPVPVSFTAPALPADQRGAAALLVSGIVAAVLAVGLGASVVARDLAERRLGFYFARPLSGWAIWAGKLGAALVLSLGVGLLFLLPYLLFEPAVRGELANGGGLQLLYGVGGIAALVLAADLVSLLVRSRSPWLGLDVVAAVAVGLLGWDGALRLIRATTLGAPGQPPIVPALQGVVPLVLLAVLAASAAQLVLGRTDPRRGHRFLSLTLWSLLLAGGLGLVGYSRWLVAATPADLVAVPIVLPAPAGSAVVVQGPAVHRGAYLPLFLLDTASGRFQRIFPVPYWGTLRVSADGRRAVWLDSQDRGVRGPAVLVRLDLTRPEARPVHTPLSFAGGFDSLALSPDGRRVALLERGRLLAFDVDKAGLLASFPLSGGNVFRSRLQFLDGSHLRYFRNTTEDYALPGSRTARIEIADFDLATGRRVEVGHTALFEDAATWAPSPDGSHLLVHRPLEALALFDVRREAPVAELPARLFGSGFLADGRVVAASPRAGSRDLTLLSPDGAVERRFPFPGVRSLRLGGEPLPGKLVIGVQTAGASPLDRTGTWESRLLDLATGDSRSLGRRLPAAGPETGPASAGSRLFFRGNDQLVLLDPVSGQEHQVAGRPDR
ncbi:MAG TPA: hypothetical protein VFE33_27545 [Thermoanaerobaculia bacterium]|nr:hypothetical protein [Thermoanaerobaculia bacterium]